MVNMTLFYHQSIKSEMREGVEKVIYIVMMGVRAEVRYEIEMVDLMINQYLFYLSKTDL